MRDFFFARLLCSGFWGRCWKMLRYLSIVRWGFGNDFVEGVIGSLNIPG